MTPQGPGPAGILKRPGVCYALTDDGLELPVIDVTHPAFRVDVSAADLARARRDHVRTLRRWGLLPAFLRRLLLRLLSRHSVLVRGFLRAEGGFFSGMNTYLLKLGPGNLGPACPGRIDRKLAGSFPALAARVRLQEVARRLARGLAPVLAARPASPLHFLNIAGGPASDSLNALIRLRQEHPDRLRRPIHSHVLDLQREAPRFGARSLAALCAKSGPLHGLTITFQHLDYDWSGPGVLQALLAGLEPGSVVAASSEGGLFSYGSDQAIRANLMALHQGTPDDCIVVGSLSLLAPPMSRARRSTRLAVRQFSSEAFEQLAAGAGWIPEQGVPSPTRQVFCLMKLP
jgi:hypothetical protein